MKELNPKLLSNRLGALLTVLGLTLSALIGGIIGTLVGFMIYALVLAGSSPIFFTVWLPFYALQLSTAMAFIIIGAPLWAIIGGWLFAHISSSHSSAAGNLGITWFSESHPIHLRVNEIARALELPPIQWIGWFEEPTINAFATGTRQSEAVIAFSQGAIERLSIGQLDAVMAHELAHVANQDMARMTYARGVQNALTWFLVFRNLKQIARWLFTPLSEIGIQTFSRNREYWADAIAAVLTKPEDMIGALEAIQNDDQQPRRRYASQATLMFHSLFSSHPETAERIKALEQGQYIYQLPLRDVTDPERLEEPVPATPHPTPAAPPTAGVINGAISFGA